MNHLAAASRAAVTKTGGLAMLLLSCFLLQP
jgi:hypothetical protein